jgi:hypothetical protein
MTPIAIATVFLVAGVVAVGTASALPSSMQDVEAQNPAVPHDTAHPLYRLGYGRRYSAKR